MNAWLIRAAQAADLPAIAELTAMHAPQQTVGLPALPTQPHEQLLVAEDRSTAQIDAVLRLRVRIGLLLPRYWYHVGCTVHAAPELQLFHRQRTLLLGNDHTGASELANLAWRDAGLPLAAQAAVLRALITTALDLAAKQREHIGPRLIIELPGVRDAAGQSPFWQGLGRHFYGGDPADAEARHGADWPSHVAALLPRHPVLAAFLPDAAQAAIAQVGARARLLRELLQACGLRYSHHVRIHDGGPVLEADLDDLGDRGDRADRPGSDMHLRKSDAAP
jgi:arginine N-succinyltransferase